MLSAGGRGRSPRAVAASGRGWSPRAVVGGRRGRSLAVTGRSPRGVAAGGRRCLWGERRRRPADERHFGHPGQWGGARPLSLPTVNFALLARTQMLPINEARREAYKELRLEMRVLRNTDGRREVVGARWKEEGLCGSRYPIAGPGLYQSFITPLPSHSVAPPFAQCLYAQLLQKCSRQTAVATPSACRRPLCSPRRISQPPTASTSVLSPVVSLACAVQQ